ncbi:MAG TPA: nucleoside-triphosphatase [Thermodesulfovibrionales bacterium]|nr:nucleoside-triphosphatase [Thermodesulfovibrionales bacterium]
MIQITKTVERALLFRARIGYNCCVHAGKKNIFLTGAPSSGKTTVIKKVVERLGLPAREFYTEEERVAGKRVGFLMKTLDGRGGYLAHQDIDSDFRIRRYGVSIENIETLAIPSIRPVGRDVIILDEIGKMECFSELFRLASVEALDASNIVVGTVTFGGEDFIRAIKAREDIEIHEVTMDTRDSLPDLILRKISDLWKQQYGMVADDGEPAGRGNVR